MLCYASPIPSIHGGLPFQAHLQRTSDARRSRWSTAPPCIPWPRLWHHLQPMAEVGAERRATDFQGNLGRFNGENRESRRFRPKHMKKTRTLWGRTQSMMFMAARFCPCWLGDIPPAPYSDNPSFRQRLHNCGKICHV